VTCLSTEELAALFDGRLPRARAVLARAHLAACPRCASEIHRLSVALEAAERGAAPPPSADLRERALALGRVPARSGDAEAPAAREALEPRPVLPPERD